MPWVREHKKAKENRYSPTDFSIPVWRVWSVIVSIYIESPARGS